jgi:predicted transcriptional regulator
MNVLLADKPCRLLNVVSKQNGKQSINDVGKTVYATYKSRWEVISELESKGLVYTEKYGREVVPYLTTKGKKVLGYVNYILAL